MPVKIERTEIYLNAVISVRKIIHGLVSLVDDAYACFVSADGDLLDVLGRFASFFELCMDNFGSLNGRL